MVLKLEQAQINEVLQAVELAGPLDHLSLTEFAYVDFAAALIMFMGGPLTSVDAFVAQIPDFSRAEHEVFWLRGKSIGRLVVQAHKGPQGQEEPAEIAGSVRSLSDVERVEISAADFVYDRMGPRIPEVRPTVIVHFNDGQKLEISVAKRKDRPARDQATKFISSLLDQLTTLGKA